MSKIIEYDSKVREAILNGVEKLEHAVSSTLGPSGRTVLIEDMGGVKTTKDGVSVARVISVKDPLENMGVQVVKQAAEKTNLCAGDGTTTTTILAKNIYKNGVKYISMGANPVKVKNGIERAAQFAIDFVKTNAKKVTTKEEIKQVAIVSANGDKEIGEVIADVMDKLGVNGTIKVEDGQSFGIESDIRQGMQFDRGYVSPYFSTNEKLESELNDAYVLITDQKITSIDTLIPTLNAVSQAHRPILIIAENVEGDALATILSNKLRGTIAACVVKAPSYGDSRKAILEDIATLTGGKVISDDTGIQLTSAIPNNGILGFAKKIVATKDSTIIMGGAGKEENIDRRATEIQNQIDSAEEGFEKDQLKERLSKLISGVGIISVGGTTDVERKERRDRVDDAFCAAKVAREGGVVAGGGVTLLQAMKALSMIDTSDMSEDEKIGVNILINSFESPIRKLCENAGIDASLIIAKIRDADDPATGYDVANKTYCNMIETGIIDAALVVENEIRNASSVAAALLTTDCMICEEPKETSCGDQPPMGMM